MFKKLFISSAFLFGVFFIPSIVSAGTIIINEVMYDLAKSNCVGDGADDNHEWIEIKNISGQSIDLTGWKFNDGSNHNLVILSEKGGQGSFIIPVGGFTILADNAIAFLSEHPGFNGTVIDTTMSLNNTSDVLKILNSDGQVIDEISYIKELGGSHDCHSLERVNDYSNQFCPSQYLGGSAGLANVPNCFVSTPTPELTPAPTPISTLTPTIIPSVNPTRTPTSPPAGGPMNVGATPSSTPSAVDVGVVISLNINEFIPNPEGSDEENEWIEIFNAGETEVNLSGWKLKDASDKEYNFKDEKIIAGEYLVLFRPQTKITINNDAETLSLIAPSGEVASQIQYSGGSQEGFSFARYAKNDWRWTSLLTPGKINEFSQTNKKGAVLGESESDISSTPLADINYISDESSSTRKIIMIAIGVGLVFSIAVLIFMKKFIP